MIQRFNLDQLSSRINQKTIQSLSQQNHRKKKPISDNTLDIKIKNELNKATDRLSINHQQELTVKEKLELMQLQQEERSVLQHERAHLVSARDLAIGGPSYQYKVGPDGKKYAIHGEVQIDSSIDSDDPQEMIDKALKIRMSAMAPADPSQKDLNAANRARIIETKAYRKLAREKHIQENKSNLPGAEAYEKLMNSHQNLNEILELFA